MSSNQRVLRQHVVTDQLLGIDSVPLHQPSLNQVGVQELAEPPQDSDPNGVQASSSRVSRFQPSPSHPNRIGQTRTAQKLPVLQAMDANEVRDCTRCELSHWRTQTVFGEGDPDAGLMFIGEGPGEKEDQQGRPFVGPAGGMLDKQIAAMGLTRQQVYITNVVKCRPPNNRAPLPTETDACWDYLRRQIQIIQPRVIVTLGGPAMKLLLDTKKGITAMRGTWHKYDGLAPQGPSIPVMPTFHPAYLLRAYTPENRKKVWSDLQQVMRELADQPG